MDPLTALGLASNIIQFVDFTSKLISAAHDLYVSPTGARLEHLELGLLATDLKQLAEQAGSPQIFNSKDLSKEEKTLQDLSKQCRAVSDELLSVLETLKVKGGHKKWKSFYQALRSVMKKRDIEVLQKRLDRIGQQMGIQILSHQQGLVKMKLEELMYENNRLGATRTEELLQLRNDTINHFKQMTQGMNEEGAKTRAFIHLSHNVEKGKEYSAEQRILESLRFETIDDRHVGIQSAHKKTFSWIFEEGSDTTASQPHTNFVKWLKSDDNLYWVSGKPGSGKSTLMKYLCTHEHTEQALKVWAGTNQLITASFFFWIAGKATLQKSQEGLLRSILYQILRQCPDLISLAVPGQWRSYISGNELSSEPNLSRLNVSELLAVFQRISADLATAKIRFCFFIDGLDEYNGRPHNIIELIEHLKSLPHVKICVSSRPWNEFEKFFGQDTSRKLYVEDLTRSDIELYVRDTLEKDPSYQELKERDSSSLDLVHDIVEAASGVFLWVFLVVRSLLEGLTNADRILDLQRRLHLLPTDLDEYFERILSTIDEFYRKQTAHMFLVTLAAQDTLPLMTYWFIHQEDSNAAMKLAAHTLSIQTATFRLQQMRKRLSACSKGLLEVRSYSVKSLGEPASSASSDLTDWKVDFLHRTVRDFLMSQARYDMFHEWATSDFNADLMICEAILAQIKTAPQGEDYFRKRGPIWKLIQIFDAQLKVLDTPATKATQVSLANELYNTLRVHDNTIDGVHEVLLSTFRVQPDRMVGEFPRSSFSFWNKIARVASSIIKY